MLALTRELKKRISKVTFLPTLEHFVTYVMNFSNHYGIFSDPPFIRKNTLINHLHSNFATDYLQLTSILEYSDLLRSYYHNLTLEEDRKSEKESVALIYSLLSLIPDKLSELDWFYCERITLHFSNYQKSIPQHTPYLLNRW